jgi:PAS domain-containing protein
LQRALYDVEYRTVGKEDGLTRWVAAKGRGIFDASGHCVRVIGTAIDITNRKLVEERLRDAMTALSETEKRTRDLFLQAPGFMCILRGPEHVFEFANDSYQLLVGARELLGKSVRAIFQEVEGQGFFELLDKVYRTGEAITGSETLLQLRRKPEDRSESHFIDFVYQPIKDAAGNVTVSLWRVSTSPRAYLLSGTCAAARTCDNWHSTHRAWAPSPGTPSRIAARRMPACSSYSGLRRVAR